MAVPTSRSGVIRMTDPQSLYCAVAEALSQSHGPTEWPVPFVDKVLVPGPISETRHPRGVHPLAGA